LNRASPMYAVNFRRERTSLAISPREQIEKRRSQPVGREHVCTARRADLANCYPALPRLCSHWSLSIDCRLYFHVRSRAIHAHVNCLQRVFPGSTRLPDSRPSQMGKKILTAFGCGRHPPAAHSGCSMGLFCSAPAPSWSTARCLLFSGTASLVSTTSTRSSS